ncbi:MAG: alpha/beta fold hydrolase [Deltaproteobacteria bacterium]|jgi:haloalkane dehalogenase|nr:alpha/beta fold hydrolase [Deltaproteobacteria bacterium]
MRSKPIDISDQRHLYPFTSHYLDLNGFKYHYVDEGSGEPVVMVHGNPTWSFYYRELIKSLSGRYRTIAPDHIGCGLSDKPQPSRYNYTLQSRIDDLDRLIETLTGPEKITLILHDWGGMIGMAYALRHPEKISRLIVLNTAAFLPPDTKKLPLRLYLIRNSGPLAAIAVLGFNLFAVGALYMASHGGLARDVKRGLTAPYNCWKNRIATLKFVQDIPIDEKDPSYIIIKQAGEQLHSLSNLPMLICWGEHDFVFDSDYLAEWRRRFPAAEIHRFSDAGHYVLEDVPEKIVPLIQDFLQKNPL